MISVTITGADDGVNPLDLISLSADFPFVEWGLLFSKKRTGTARYPTEEWTKKFIGAGIEKGVRVSLHLCGSNYRLLAEGNPAAVPVAIGACRLQVNGYTSAALPGVMSVAERFQSLEFILQARKEETLQEVCRDAEKLPNASVLFDPSSGRGVEPFGWPRTPIGSRVGFAGGIKPENVETVIGDIAAAHSFLIGDFWIDMESGVRDGDDRFSVSRARSVLESVSRINARLSTVQMGHETKFGECGRPGCRAVSGRVCDEFCRSCQSAFNSKERSKS
jgi:hypothetical protein